MFFRKRDPERDRYYLLAGMGRRLARKKARKFLAWSVATALVVSAILSVAIYYLSKDHMR